ncbi:hypothetical protein D7X88_05035 [bacterium C-53]|nr:hypothetical protein [Lachnospiraceae bacterium]NBI02589.1 hypothetical protein [Lachnospiraceae bacterium]RKJ11231.1 hypothetical protein D7X88_05035 [bacterium C-53]
MLRTLAIYLPQFHRVPENDEWWGEGFTEWTAVKGAEKLFEGHNQPRVPLNKNYYNLLEHDTMAWQADLMKKYFVDGMCIYHYWFENGRRILEKPAENLLKWTDIQMPFCFYWANQTWTKTWKKLTGACIWSNIYETSEKKIETGILLKQSYGREKEWEDHFLYLLPFFKDERYIKLDGKPVFIIYRPDDIFSLWDMADYFDMRAKQSGFQGIYLIGSGRGVIRGLNATFEKQPDWKVDSYDEMWKMTLSSRIEKNCKTYFCGGVDFDNSPRMGKNSFIMKGASPLKFYTYFKELYKRSLLLDNEFVFVNAWNEWGEGMYLEPDEKYGFGYLESLKKAIAECRNEQSVNKGNNEEENYYTEEDIYWRKMIQDMSRHDSLLHNWLCLKENTANFSMYFKKYGYHNVAIYGMGKLGIHLLHELRESGINACFGIDENSEKIMCEIKVYSPNQHMPKVDAVIITIINQYSEIADKLRESMDCPMITLEEIIQELMLQ